MWPTNSITIMASIKIRVDRENDSQRVKRLLYDLMEHLF